MSIKGNNTSGLIDAVSGDFTILENTTKTRWAVTQIHLHEYGGVGDTIQLFQSANAKREKRERREKRGGEEEEKEREEGKKRRREKKE